MSFREKMICSILLLIILTSCVSGTLVVNVTQTSYQAEENQHITLEWTFTTNPHTSSNSLNIFCELLTDLNNPVLFHLHEGVEVPESHEEQFAGRVQWDKDVLREGRLRLHVSRLRTSDSGLYLCDVLTSYGSSSGKCWLNVTAARDRPEPETPNTTSPPQPESRGWIGLYCVVGLTTAAALLAGCFCLFRKRRMQREPDSHLARISCLYHRHKENTSFSLAGNITAGNHSDVDVSHT